MIRTSGGANDVMIPSMWTRDIKDQPMIIVVNQYWVNNFKNGDSTMFFQITNKKMRSNQSSTCKQLKCQSINDRNRFLSEKYNKFNLNQFADTSIILECDVIETRCYIYWVNSKMNLIGWPKLNIYHDETGSKLTFRINEYEKMEIWSICWCIRDSKVWCQKNRMLNWMYV